MADLLSHRGPDETVLVQVPGGAFVSSRLAILDPGGSGQPFSDCAESVSVVFSGEIYNYRELRTELRASGHRFVSGGDGEVIAHLYEEVGDAFPLRLRGAFAIAVFDYRADRVVLARDRLGEKPLLYRVSANGLEFASEVRALSTDPSRMFNVSNMLGYVHYGFVLEPDTLFEGIHKVPAGTTVTLDRSRSSVRVTRYWSPIDLEQATVVAYDGTDLMASTFALAIQQQVHADVPTAVALSDGIDSTILARTAARYVPRLITYSVSFDWVADSGPAAIAEQTALEIDALHRRVSISPSRYQELLVEGASKLSEPIADWTMPAYLGMLSRCRDDGVRVLLTGHGVDEIFLAYDWTRRVLRAHRAENSAGLHDAYLFNPEYREARDVMDFAVLPRAATDLTAMRTLPITSENDARSEIRQHLLSGYLRSNGLMQLDSLGLLRDVEVRLPYVDHEFVKAAIASDGYRQCIDEPKEALYGMASKMDMPIARRSKEPFFPELSSVSGPVVGLAELVLPDGVLVDRGLVDRTGLLALLAATKESGFGLNVVYRLLVMELWLLNLDRPIRDEVVFR